MFDLNHWFKKNDNGERKFEVHKNSIPFGVGQRQCLGRMLAVQQIQGIVANILVNYTIEGPNYGHFEIKTDGLFVKHVVNDFPLKMIKII